MQHPSDPEASHLSRYRRLTNDKVCAAGLDLWFGGGDFVPPHRKNCHARGKSRAQRGRADIVPAVGGKGPGSRPNFSSRSAEQCWLLKRLIAFVVTGVTVIAGGGAAQAGTGQPRLGNSGCKARRPRLWTISSGSMTFCSWLIAAITLFVLILLAIVVVKFNTRSNPTPSPHHPQHRHRDHLDRGAGADPGDDRSASFRHCCSTN